jgi:ABC-type nitrate/sulfonate/bicarbonate transport system substrate-binding protein
MEELRMKRVFVVLLVASLLAFLSVTPTCAQSPESRQIIIGYPSRSLNVLTLHVAITNGYFAKEGLSVLPIQMRADVAVAAMMNGNVHYNLGFPAPMSAMLRGMPFRFIAVISRFLHQVVSRPELKTASALKGKKFGVSRIEGGDHLQAKDILKAKGSDPKDIEFINLGLPDQGRMQAIRQGLVDAIAVSPPNPVVLKKDGYNVIGGPSDLKVGLLAQAISTTEMRIRENPEEVRKVLRAILQAVRFIREQRPDTINLIAKWMVLTPELATASYEASAPNFSPNGAFSDADIQYSMDTIRAGMNLSKPIPLAQVRDFEILKRAQKDVGLQ